VLVWKLGLVPVLLIAVTLAVRRFGPRFGGLAVGLPLTSGPVSLFLAVEQGPAFARSAAPGTIAGLTAVCVFSAAYALCAASMRWIGALVVALLAYVVIGLALSWLASDLALATAVTLFSIVIGLVLVPPTAVRRSSTPPPAWDLPARVVVATTIVLLLTEGARALGPSMTGLLSAFPLFVAVLASFTHAQNGAAAARALLRGVIGALPSFAAFFVCVALGLRRLDVATCYALAIVVTAATQLVALRSWARSGGARAHSSLSPRG
jgi:uncharacterized membrane protein (GlpM family)